MKGTFHIAVVGCQMNVLDAELLAGELLRAGWLKAENIRRADVVLFVTCSVRQHAEDKVYSALGRLKPAANQRRRRIIGVVGCMAQQEGERILRRAPHVDLLVGPGRLHLLPELLERILSGEGPLVELSLDRAAADLETVRLSFQPFAPPREVAVRPAPHQAMVHAMCGCDMGCSYCVVPRARGPQRSRPAADILAEVRRLADQGCLEVTLLGQTVNAYCDRSGGRELRLADLLSLLDGVEGIWRLKFVTNHPRHMSDDLLQAVRDLPKVSPYLHVPAQSGSDAVLRRMRRGHAAAAYREMLDRIRATIPAASITSDFIVGFPGETEEDFQQTVELVRAARFRNSFIFKYSARPGTAAAELYADDVPDEVKRRRNNELLAVQNAISLEDNLPLAGQSLEVLVEGPSKLGRKSPSDGNGTVQLTGRTTCERIVVFDGPPRLAGRLLKVRIERAEAFTLFGQPMPGN
jgi:tRNA-2-methylthio-N6-dimethylallyladenosine synthase